MDTDWIKRLAALMQLGRDLVGMLIVVLGLALAAITANTIRLQIYAQKDEIELLQIYRKAKSLKYADINVSIQEGARVKLWLTEKMR